MIIFMILTVSPSNNFSSPLHARNYYSKTEHAHKRELCGLCFMTTPEFIFQQYVIASVLEGES
jgi:hypothetical protein